jgi:hypothetical protein
LHHETGQPLEHWLARYGQPNLIHGRRCEIESLHRAFEFVPWEPALVRRILQLMQAVDGAWRIQSVEDLDGMRPLLAACLASGLKSILAVSKDGVRNSGFDQCVASIAGLHVDTIAARNFTNGLLGRLSFLPKEMDLAGRARHQPHSMFLVNVVTLATLLKVAQPEVFQ